MLGSKIKSKYVNFKNKKRNIDKSVNINFKKRIIYLSALIIAIILCIFLVGKLIKAKDTKLLLIDGEAITKSVFNIYAYAAKYNYFGTDLSKISKDDLNVVYDETTNATVKDYLKSVALNDIKTTYAIKSLANKYDVKLADEDYAKIKKDKEDFISNLGGKNSFKKFLKENGTTETAYDDMAYSDALYQKILDAKYSKGKINDLTPQEYETAKNEYPYQYYKIKQIILTTIDLNTGKSLSNIAINQKETLANYVANLANKKGQDFDELIAKYSEDADNKQPPYDLYYKKGTLLKELEETLQTLSTGMVSAPVKTKYAFHIILKEKIDDAKLDEYYESLREKKYIKDLKDVIDNQKIVYYKAYENIEVE